MIYSWNGKEMQKGCGLGETWLIGTLVTAGIWKSTCLGTACQLYKYTAKLTPTPSDLVKLWVPDLLVITCLLETTPPRYCQVSQVPQSLFGLKLCLAGLKNYTASYMKPRKWPARLQSFTRCQNVCYPPNQHWQKINNLLLLFQSPWCYSLEYAGHHT